MGDAHHDPFRIVPAEVMRSLARMAYEAIADKRLEEERQAVDAPVVRFDGEGVVVTPAEG